MNQLRSATGIIAVVTVLVSAATFLTGTADAAALFGGFIPARLSGAMIVPGAIPAVLTPLSATLLHGSWLHLGLNLLVLVWVGKQLETVLGVSGAVACYVVGAFAAALAQFAFGPVSTVPMVGASGAISAWFGTYALMFGQPKHVFKSNAANRGLHAAWLLAAWIVIQWMTAVLAGTQGMMLATPAHIGGFLAGLLLQRPLLLWRYRRA